MKPHKHAELIKAWADGAEIQYKDEFGDWNNANGEGLYWGTYTEYRIKPVVKKYRVALMNGYTGTVDDEKEAKATEFDRCFVRWLTDWVEYTEELK